MADGGSTNRGPRIAVVGVTGAVGTEFLRLFEQRGTALGELIPLASARSAGGVVRFRGEDITIREATEDAFGGVDIAYFSAGGSVSKTLCPAAAKAGAIVIDNSSAFRMDPGVPLVVPEVNPEHLGGDFLGSGERIIANPNCSTIILLVAVTPIHRRFGIRRMVVSTYQAVSGAGQPGLDALEAEILGASRGEAPRATYFPEPCCGNVFLHESPMDPVTGRTQEEQKMIDETRKMWGQAGWGELPADRIAGPAVNARMLEPVRVAATCVRVGVRRAHSESVNIELAEPATVEEIRSLLAGAPGVKLVDDRSTQSFPTPLKADGGDDVLVGRIRGDESQTFSVDPGGTRRYTGIELFCSGDQIRKGAALNAVQIGDLVAN